MTNATEASPSEMVTVRAEDIEAVRDLELQVTLLLKTMRRTVPSLNRLAKAGVFTGDEWARDLVRESLKTDDERSATLALVAEGLADLRSFMDYAEAKGDYEELVLKKGLTVNQAAAQLRKDTGTERRADELMLYKVMIVESPRKGKA